MLSHESTSDKHPSRQAKRYVSKTFEDQITEIVDEFDWKKVNIGMRFLKWRWCDFGRYSVPSVARLKSVAISLLENASEKNVISSATGGFIASRTKAGTLSLVFAIDHQSSWQCELDEENGCLSPVRKSSRGIKRKQ